MQPASAGAFGFTSEVSKLVILKQLFKKIRVSKDMCLIQLLIMQIRNLGIFFKFIFLQLVLHMLVIIYCSLCISFLLSGNENGSVKLFNIVHQNSAVWVLKRYTQMAGSTGTDSTWSKYDNNA